MKKSFIYIGIVLIIIIAVAIYFVVLKKECPVSCNDNDSCTKDLCSKETNYKCVNEAIKPCCKNNNCSTSELALSLTDLPIGWEISARGERVKADVSDYGLNLGWKEGYQIVFRKESNPDLEILETISLYPQENVSLVLNSEKNELKALNERGINGLKIDYRKDTYGRKYRLEELKNLSLGDDSVAYKIIYIESDGNAYFIDFIKGNYYVSISGYDYELMKELASKAEKMI